jgi:hypothetical protein
MNTGYPISTAYLVFGVLIALGILLLAAAIIGMVLHGPFPLPFPLPLDPGLPYPVNVR